MDTNLADPQSWSTRVERAFHGKDLAQVLSAYKAIVGPMNDEKFRQSALQARDLLAQGRRPSPTQLAALEFSLRLMRPAPLVQSGTVAALNPETAGAFPDWSGFQQKVAPFVRSVGRVDQVIAGKAQGQHTGTGFLVSDRLLVTNRHVLDALSHGTWELEPGQAVVRFQQEYQTPASEEPVVVEGVVAVHENEDLALLKLTPVPLSGQRQPLVFDDTPARVGDPVAALGYPANDPYRNPEFVPLLFGGIFGVKRCAPGELISRLGTTLHHDCSTLGGNSGSPILSLRTGKIVSVHKEGTFLYRNGSVDAATAKAFIAPHL